MAVGIMLPVKDEPLAKRPRREESVQSFPPATTAALPALLPERTGQGDGEAMLQLLADKPVDVRCDPPRSDIGDTALNVVSDWHLLGMAALVEDVERSLSKRNYYYAYLHLKLAMNHMHLETKGNMKVQDNATSLEVAEGNGDIEVNHSFVKKGSQAEDKWVAFLRYLLRREVGTKTEQVKEILQKIQSAAVVRAYADIVPDQVRGEAGRCGLLSAARGGHSEVMVALLEAGVNANVRIYGNYTALHLAALYGHTACVRELLGWGAEVNARDLGGGTPLHKACSQGHVECVRELLEKCADVNAKENNGWTPLHEACYRGKAECVQELLGRGVDISARDNLGRTPLHRACCQAGAEVVRKLLDEGADVEAKDNFGWTPLHFTCDRGEEECARDLVWRGADVNAKDKGGWTPLHRASERGHVKCVRELLASGADVTVRDNLGKTPTYVAFRRDRVECLEELFRRSPIVNAEVNEGHTPLQRLSTEEI